MSDDIRTKPSVEIDRLAKLGAQQGTPWYSMLLNHPILNSIDQGAHINSGVLAKLQQQRMVDAARRAALLQGGSTGNVVGGDPDL